MKICQIGEKLLILFKFTLCNGVVPLTQIQTQVVYKINIPLVATVQKFMKICKIGEMILIFSSQISILVHCAVVNFGEVRRASQPNPVSSPPRWCPWDLFISYKVLSGAKEREWGAESIGKPLHLFIPSKNAALVPEFEMEDLPQTELQPRFLRLQ